MSHARDRMNTDPAQVLNDMKLLFDEVMRVGELSSDQRAELRSQITALMEQASQRRFEKKRPTTSRGNKVRLRPAIVGEFWIASS